MQPIIVLSVLVYFTSISAKPLSNILIDDEMTPKTLVDPSSNYVSNNVIENNIKGSESNAQPNDYLGYANADTGSGTSDLIPDDEDAALGANDTAASGDSVDASGAQPAFVTGSGDELNADYLKMFEGTTFAPDPNNGYYPSYNYNYDYNYNTNNDNNIDDPYQSDVLGGLNANDISF